LSVFQWIGSNDADLGNGGNWVDTTEPGMGQPPGTNDVAIIQVGEGLYGTLNVAGLDIVQASGAPTISITGSSTQITASSLGIGLGFTLDNGAYLQAGTMGIDGDGTVVTVQNNALIYDLAGENDVLSIGASSGSANVLLTKGGSMYYASQDASGTLNLGGVSNSTATLTVSDQGYFAATLSGINIGAAAGSTGILNVTGAGSQFLADNYGYTTIGDFGELGGSAQGTVSVTDGGYASLSSDGEVDVGTSAGMAKIVVSGANSAIETGPYLEIGENGTNIAGEILVQTGGEFDNATDAYLNNGTIAVTGANSVFTGRFLVADNGTTVQIGTGGLIHVADAELAGTVKLSAGDLNVRADLYLYGGSEITGTGTVSAVAISNSGLFIASGGTLVVGGSITGTGTAQIQSGATLQLLGSVGSSQTITFEKGANTLSLADLGGFAGQITDFGTGDTIDLLATTATTLSYAGGALTIDNGTTKIGKIDIKGHYKTANFKLTSDGHGDSIITYTATSAVDPRPVVGPVGAIWPLHGAF
jgi:T5SS/PEP-CTERM-associated repeat protein